ncbi:MAG: hypothetical protein Kow0069_11200 [Promethearchaeota archaeon]
MDEDDPNFPKYFHHPGWAATQIAQKLRGYEVVEKPAKNDRVAFVIRRPHGFFEIGLGKAWIFPRSFQVIGPVFNTSDRVKKFVSGKVEVIPGTADEEVLLAKIPVDKLDRIRARIERIPRYGLYDFYADL